MKRILLTLLVVIIGLGLFAASGYAGYRFGYAQGVQATANEDAPLPRLRPFEDFGPREMPRHDFGFDRGFGRSRFPMMGFGFFSPLLFLGQIAILALIIWFIVWLFTRRDRRLTRQTSEPVSHKTENE